MREKLRLLVETVLVATVLAAAASSAFAQDVLLVTGVSGPGAAWLEDADGDRTVLGTRDADTGVVQDGLVRVAPGQQLMLLSDSGVVMILLGPAKLACSSDDSETLVVLHEGKLIVAATWPDVAARPLVVLTPPGEDGLRAIEAIASPGYSYFHRRGGRARVGYRSGGGFLGAMALTARGQVHSIKDGEVLTVEGPMMRVGAAAEWLASEQLDMPWGVNLGIASAQAARPRLESDLFVNITSWDLYGGKEHVTSCLDAGRFRPEAGQTVTTVSTPQQAPPAPSGIPEPTRFPAANEVPQLSPAALGVVNPTENVTAIQLYIQARRPLTQTADRGVRQ